jgi:hypothetical protein
VRDVTSDLHQPMGLTGVPRSGGTIIDEYARGLIGSQRAAEVYREMRDDGLPGAFVSLVRLIAGSVTLDVEPPPDLADDATALRLRDDWRTRIDRLETPLSEVVQELLESAVVYGLGMHEPIVRLEGGRWRTIDLEPRGGDTVYQWRLDDRDRPIAVQQRVRDGRTAWLEIDRIVHAPIPTHNRSPEGRSLFRSGWRHWQQARDLSTDEAIGVGRDLTGVPVIELPPDIMSASADPTAARVRAEYEQIGARLRAGRSAYVLIPSAETRDGKTGYGIRLMTSGGTQRVVADTPIRRHESRLMISLLSEFMLLGTESVGSRALADPKINLTQLAIGSLVRQVLSALSYQWIARLVRWEGGDDRYAPRLTHSAIDPPDLPELVALLSQASTAGLVVPTEELARHILSQIPGAPVSEPAVRVDVAPTAPTGT